MLFFFTNVYSQGEYFKNGESGLIVGRLVAFNHGNQLNSVGVGFSYFGRIDISMIQEDRNSLFSNENSYSLTGHIFKQGASKKENIPFSLAVSIAQSNSNTTTISLTPYMVFDLGTKIELLLNAGVIISHNASYRLSVYSYPFGLSILGNLSKNIALVIESGIITSKLSPGFGANAIIVFNF